MVKEIFKTLQGEGANTGRVSVFCRFSGCNLWSGREEDRAKAICKFCDTDFRHGVKFSNASALANLIEECWAGEKKRRFVVFTGGEPLLQLDTDLIAAIKDLHFHVAVETNGTVLCPNGVNWLCVSPKAGSNVIQRDGNELKLVFPQAGLSPEVVEDWNFERFYLQPMAGDFIQEYTAAAVQYCLDHPQWRLSLQTHKIIGVP